MRDAGKSPQQMSANSRRRTRPEATAARIPSRTATPRTALCSRLSWSSLPGQRGAPTWAGLCRLRSQRVVLLGRSRSRRHRGGRSGSAPGPGTHALSCHEASGSHACHHRRRRGRHAHGAQGTAHARRHHRHRRHAGVAPPSRCAACGDGRCALRRCGALRCRHALLEGREALEEGFQLLLGLLLLGQGIQARELLLHLSSRP
mmetsp:Transcript_103399/g.267437  ORF Transcript_103399/g.267437 Transcript_103399/m.267437 type:complete len:203 (+) Transcript_103399:175-783(+)